MNKNYTWRIKAICLALMMMTAFALSPLSAAASDVLDLSFANRQDIISQNPTRFSVSDDDKIITVSGLAPITITGESRGRGVKIIAATEINIEGGTKIIHITETAQGPQPLRTAALEVPGGATIHGNGEGIIISATYTNATQANVFGIYTAHGSVTISGDIDKITSANSSGTTSVGVHAGRGDVTISGTVGDITGRTGISADGDVIISGSVGDIGGGNGSGIWAIGSVTISGTAGNITSKENSGISAIGSVTISGSVGDIGGGGGSGISANGSVTISGTVGDITGSNILTAFGIDAGGSVTISGSVGDITGSSSELNTAYGISANGSVTISGTVGDITGDRDRYGIDAGGSVTISGSVGEITGGVNGIKSWARSVTISGKIDVISGDVPIDAASYAVLDYVHPDDLIVPDQDKLFPSIDHTVIFNYDGMLPPGGDTPKKAYIALGERKIPEPSAPDYVPVHWYREPEFKTRWNFETDTVSDDIILYAREIRSGGGGGCRAGAGMAGALLLAFVLSRRRFARYNPGRHIVK